MRLKLKRSSTSQGKLGNTKISKTQATFHIAPSDDDVDELVLEEHPRDVKQPTELPVHETRAQALATADEASDCGTAPVHVLMTIGSPGISYRWSSIIAVAPDVVQPITDVHRLASTRPVRSFRSHASRSEPINSTRLGIQISRLTSRAPRLVAPDLASSLSLFDLDMSVRHSDILSNPRPALHENRSRFSGDSSATQS